MNERATTGAAPLSREHRDTCRILHVSDLHFGRHFQEARWKNLLSIVKRLNVDTMVVTGDLVNSPWRWQRKSVLRRLQQLEAAAGLTPVQEAQVSSSQWAPNGALPPSTVVGTLTGDSRRTWVIAGNHDTRWSGVLPVAWLTRIAVGSAVATLAAGYLSRWRYASGLAGPWLDASLCFAFLTTLATVGRLCLVSNIAAEMKNYYLRGPWMTPDGNVGFVPLDSATAPLRWANGHVRSQDMADLRTRMDDACAGLSGTGEEPLWIALVHHHLLPLPHDSTHEPMMVMDNAGALLHELTTIRVSLVLHGHKHHQHFARILVGAASRPYAELAVLSAGTPTSERLGASGEHGFNVIDVHADSRVTIYPFEAPTQNGTLQPLPAFEMVPPEVHARNMYETNIQRLPLVCKRLLCVTHINGYGDATFVREFSDVRAREQRVSGLADPIIAEVDAGLVEALVAKASPGGPEIVLTRNRKAPGLIEAQLQFKGGLDPSHDPFEMRTEFFANNVVALNSWQYECMYPNRADRQEQLRWDAPKDVAIEELVLHVRFPTEAVLPWVRVRVSTPQRPEPEVPPTARVVNVDPQNVVQVSIAHPTPGSCYMITWTVEDPPTKIDKPPRQQAILRAAALRKRMGDIPSGDVPPAFGTWLLATEQKARAMLSADPAKKEAQFDIAVYCPTGSNCGLRYFAGTHPADDPRRNAVYPFGLHVIGRAFKSGATSYFVKPAHLPERVAWGYTMPHGGAPKLPTDVPECAMLAFPLVDEAADDWPYAVLVLSTDNPEHALRTSDTATDPAIEKMASALQLVMPTVESILRP